MNELATIPTETMIDEIKRRAEASELTYVLYLESASEETQERLSCAGSPSALSFVGNYLLSAAIAAFNAEMEEERRKRGNPDE
jgi:hypothetical protein